MILSVVCPLPIYQRIQFSTEHTVTLQSTTAFWIFYVSRIFSFPKKKVFLYGRKLKWKYLSLCIRIRQWIHNVFHLSLNQRNGWFENTLSKRTKMNFKLAQLWKQTLFWIKCYCNTKHRIMTTVVAANAHVTTKLIYIHRKRHLKK